MSESQPAQSLANVRRTVISKRPVTSYSRSLANAKRISAAALTTAEAADAPDGEWSE
ncbi:hypothetical protein ACK8GG_13370 [Micromonosporaceae bacterium DT55]|uniref:hypothetical protein n=1 Tax=Melissospora conviva TaxID=3388432 RepID=UPI003C159A35